MAKINDEVNMLELKLKTKTVMIMDDIDDLPIKLFNMANEYSMQDFEIGNDMAAVDRHEQRIEMLLVNKKSDEAIQVQKNKRMAYYSMINRINYKSLMFASHIRAIDNETMTDYSPTNLMRTIDNLSDDGLTMGMVRQTLDSIKKKLKSN